ncbi:hypothetical protein LOK49_LG05G03872 [Camellia lanceoleosa]|uniref:Uncharacterized protein n=1 Tax=Camellia lanceoleosa TaxID=1840588 RepID=A0ACC0HU46_9ERIC|nr:hypothetical protein LOK49_LG05G03872 [Camellia lanceoleosa]
MSGYKNVANKFLDKTSLLHSAKQMKNKYDNLKKDWVAWKKLEKARQGLTGLGYNQETGLNSFVFMLVDGRSMFLPIVYDMGNVYKVYKPVHGTVVSYAGLLK